MLARVFWNASRLPSRNRGVCVCVCVSERENKGIHFTGRFSFFAPDVSPAI